MITLSVIAALSPDSIAWDEGRGSVAGFGARRQKSQAVNYFIKYRTTDGRQRWQSIGRHGAPWTPEMARNEAKRLLGEVVAGNDPAALKQDIKKAATVSELCDDYIKAAEAGRVLTRRRVAKKPSTLSTDKGRIERHIKPLLGRLKVGAVTRLDIEKFRDGVADGATQVTIKTGKHGLARVTGGQGAASRTLGLLGAIFTFAQKRGLRTDNPCKGIERFADGQRERRLSNQEYEALGSGLTSMPKTIWPIAVAAAKFLAVTGWRRDEVITLTWTDVDLVTRTARLQDTKSGRSMRPLSKAACKILSDLPKTKGVLVFPSSQNADKPMRGFHKTWLRIAVKAGLPADITPQVLRHSFASNAADLGYTELTIAALIGHRKGSVTSKYVHHADAVLMKAADTVADQICGLMREDSIQSNVLSFPG